MLGIIHFYIAFANFGIIRML